MIETAERFVAFIDILGFKDLLQRKSHEEILEKLKKLSTYVKDIAQPRSNSNESEILSYVFSDTIMLFTRDNSQKSLNALLLNCDYIIANSVLDFLPLKGAIAYGKISIEFENSIFFGQPIIDAYLLQEELKYYGIIFHHTAEDYYKKENLNTNLVVWIDTFMKYGINQYYNLSWPKVLQFIISKSKEPFKIEDLFRHVSGPARTYAQNTITMFKSILAIDPLTD